MHTITHIFTCISNTHMHTCTHTHKHTNVNIHVCPIYNMRTQMHQHTYTKTSTQTHTESETENGERERQGMASKDLKQDKKSNWRGTLEALKKREKGENRHANRRKGEGTWNSWRDDCEPKIGGMTCLRYDYALRHDP